jgi:hypothetical protein
MNTPSPQRKRGPPLLSERKSVLGRAGNDTIIPVASRGWRRVFASVIQEWRGASSVADRRSREKKPVSRGYGRTGITTATLC